MNEMSLLCLVAVPGVFCADYIMSKKYQRAIVVFILTVVVSAILMVAIDDLAIK